MACDRPFFAELADEAGERNIPASLRSLLTKLGWKHRFILVVPNWREIKMVQPIHRGFRGIGIRSKQSGCMIRWLSAR